MMILASVDWGSIVIQTISQGLGPLAAAYAIAAIGLNVHFGYGGLLNFGQIGFLAVGGYGLGIGVTKWDLPFFAAVPVGVVFGVILALILGLPTLRLRADYLAIVTIASSEIIRLLARSTLLRDYTRGAEGLGDFNDGFVSTSPFSSSDRYEFGPTSIASGSHVSNFDVPLLRSISWRPLEFSSGNDLWVAICGWALAFLCAGVVWTLMRSPWGRLVRAVREDEDAARALGKSAYGVKMQVLILGGGIGALAGMVNVTFKGSVQPDFFIPPQTFWIWVILIMGGAGRVMSPILGAIVFMALQAFIATTLRELVNNDVIPTDILDGNQVGQVVFMLTGLGLMLLMVFRPQGFFGNREEMALDGR